MIVIVRDATCRSYLHSKDKYLSYLIKSKVPEIEIASPRFVALPLSISSVKCLCFFCCY